MAEPSYAEFSRKLLPGVANVLGVRLPALRKLARELARGDWRAAFEVIRDDSFEETLLKGMLIGYAKADMDELLRYTARYVPLIGDWSTCDSFVAGLKWVKSDPERAFAFLAPFLDSEAPFAKRFAVVTLLFYFINERDIDRTLDCLASVRNEAYYVRMAVAWAAAECYVSFPEKAASLLAAGRLDDWTRAKSVQKICESRAVSAEGKARARAITRKKG